jgi:hypothetical protein
MDPTEIRFIQTAFIKERGAEVKKNPPVPHPLRALHRFCATSSSFWQFGNKLPTAHTALSTVFNSLHIAVGNDAMNKYGIC